MKDGGNIDVCSGCSNWKNASGKTGGFSSHERSKCHKTALEIVVSLPKTTKDVGEMLSSTYAEGKKGS